MPDREHVVVANETAIELAFRKNARPQLKCFYCQETTRSRVDSKAIAWFHDHGPGRCSRGAQLKTLAQALGSVERAEKALSEIRACAPATRP